MQGVKADTLTKKTNKKFGITFFLTKGLGDSEIIRTFASLEPAKPLHDAQMCGSFYILSIMTDDILVLYHYPLCGFLILYYDYPFTIFTATFTSKDTNFL